MKKNLTDRFLVSVKKPASGRDIYSDTIRVGLNLRVGAQKTWRPLSVG